jgi:hypothetical protein
MVDAPRTQQGVHATPVADKIAALFSALTREEVDCMSPAQRERFAALCQHWADFAKIRPAPPKSGVLVDLKGGRQT